MDILFKYKLIFVDIKKNYTKKSNIIFAYIKYIPAITDEEDSKRKIYILYHLLLSAEKYT